MIEIYPNLYVSDYREAKPMIGAEGWFVVSAAKEPEHRKAVGYETRAAPKDDPEYLIAERPGHLILNLIDAPSAAYIPEAIMTKATQAIHDHLTAGDKVLVHCNEGLSRAPTIALLYLNQFTDRFAGMDHWTASNEFEKIYPGYKPADGVNDYARGHWK